MSKHPPAQNITPAQNTNSARIWKEYSRIPYNHSETPITPPAQNIKHTLHHITPQPSTPIKHAGSELKPEPDTNKHITPQPSTPIKHAGSDC